MNARKVAVLFAGAITACESNTPRASNQATTASATSQAGLMKAVAPASAPPRALPTRATGMVGGSVGTGDVAATEDGQTNDAAAQPVSGVDQVQSASATTVAPMMVIRTGQAFIEVEKVDAAILRIRQLAAQVGGYVTNSSISGGHDQIRQATLEVKIPAPRYDEAVSSLSTIGKVETVNSQAEEVGEEYVDVTARVTNARRLEERLLTLLSNRTGKLDEVLRVERELARVREEIERYEGRLRYLSTRAATSTLTVTVHEPAPIIGNNPGENPILAAVRRAWRNFVGLVAFVIASLGVLLPLVLLGLAGWFGYRRWRYHRATS